MNLTPLLAIREHLKDDALLSTYLSTTYPTATPVFAVATKYPASTNEYPWISLSLAGEVRDEARVAREQILIIYISVLSPGTPEDDPYLFNGLAEVAEISELIMKSLYSYFPSGVKIKRDIDTMTDFSIKHPFYSCGIKVNLLVKDT